ncbi:hypothetical protein L1987_46474 [Smallanthus sonchifolius]|uniref:Uncharacterized protein n=1 Tax=Smallanthus sonchifolius TaxID=185202 RepID=A0ACB9G0S9_9ASTR|nr:hypothetical protein L1987_46474 [Smallanthus sonchifolius]
MPEKVNWFCDECNSVWNVNLEGLEIISSPTRPIRSREHTPAFPIIREPAIKVPVPVDEAQAPVDRALTPPPKDTRPAGEGIVLGESSVYEIGGKSAAGGGMVLKGKVECLDDVSDAHYGRFVTLEEERLLEEDATNKMHFHINDLEVAGVTTGQRLQALEDRLGVTEVGLLTVQQRMSGMAVSLDLTQAYSFDIVWVDVVQHKLPMAPATRTGGSSGSTPLPSSSEDLAQVVEAGEKFGDVEKKPFDGKRKNSGFPKSRSGFKNKRN